MLVIIDYDMGNLHSVKKALGRIGVDSKVSDLHSDIESAEKLILPGVGHFKNGIENLKKNGTFQLINKKVMQDKTPILGICLGMQLFVSGSEEGDSEGFGWIEGRAVKFDFHATDKKLKSPHMGWNNLHIKKQHAVFSGITEADAFYFAHSYYVNCVHPSDILSNSVYGIEFVSSFQKENITGVQFHPEKSHDAGLKILNNFCKTN